MNKKLGIFIIIGLVALIGIGIYFYVKNTSTNNEKTNYEANRTSVESNTSNEGNTSDNKTTANETTNTTSENTSNTDNTPKTIEEQLSAFSTKIYSNDTNRTKNMEITTTTLDRTIVKNGEIFSFCNTVRPCYKQ